MSSLGDPMDSPLRETAGHSISTTLVAFGTAAPLLPRNNRSTAWDHFTVEIGKEKKARCNYCGTLIKYRDGTSGMQTHLKRCKKNPYTVTNKRPRTGASSQTIEGQVGGGVGSSPTYFKYDQEADELKLKMTSGLKSLYEQYQGIEERSQINQEVQLGNDDDDVHEMTSPHEGTSSVAINLDDRRVCLIWCGTVAQVLESGHSDYKKGYLVWGITKWEGYAQGSQPGWLHIQITGGL
ncbi:Zinc finger, BED-type [Sesbania bispinosa]|nr:Zinc finger, BED-type [Sesbania bispinosa]